PGATGARDRQTRPKAPPLLVLGCDPQEVGTGSSITASALSSDTSQLRAGSGVKGVPRQRGVISTLDAADGSPEWNSGTKSSAVDWTPSLGRIFRADLSTKARLLESCGGPRFVHQSSMRSSRP